MFIILGRWVQLAVSMVTGVQLWLLLVGVECRYVRSWSLVMRWLEASDTWNSEMWQLVLHDDIIILSCHSEIDLQLV